MERMMLDGYDAADKGLFLFLAGGSAAVGLFLLGTLVWWLSTVF